MKAALFVLLLTACASPPPERYLTVEEDAALGAYCKPRGGCAAVPIPLWREIRKLFEGMAGTAI